MTSFHDLLTDVQDVFQNSMEQARTTRTSLFQSKSYSKLVDKLTHKNRKLSQHKKETIHQVIHDCLMVYRALMPLYQFNIHFTLSLAGGSVREILLDKYQNIKDLDLILSIRKIKYPSIKQMHEAWGFDALEHFWLAPTNDFGNHQQRNHNQALQNKEKTYLIIRHLLAKNLHITEDYAPKMDNGTQPEYLMRDLNGVIKIHSEGQHFPIDLLITHNSVEDFLSKFDFNICKAVIRLVDERETALNILRFPDNAHQFLRNYQPNSEFLHDVSKKKVSMDMDNRSVSDINRSIETHLPRIVAKYPEFEVNFMLNEHSAINYTEKQSIIMRYQLEKTLSKEMRGAAARLRKI